MNKETLLQKRDAINIAFENQRKVRDEANNELFRLQGEYRLIDELIDRYDPVKAIVEEYKKEE